MGHIRQHLVLFRPAPVPAQPPRWHDNGGSKPRRARMRWETNEGKRKQKQAATAIETNLMVIAAGFEWANIKSTPGRPIKSYKGNRSVMGEKKYTRRARV